MQDRRWLILCVVGLGGFEEAGLFVLGVVVDEAGEGMGKLGVMSEVDEGEIVHLILLSPNTIFSPTALLTPLPLSPLHFAPYLPTYALLFI